jgi:hypothetical protein
LLVWVQSDVINGVAINYIGITLLELGCKDSNLGMSGPKPDALPLGDTPIMFGCVSQISLIARYLL